MVEGQREVHAVGWQIFIVRMDHIIALSANYCHQWANYRCPRTSEGLMAQPINSKPGQVVLFQHLSGWKIANQVKLRGYNKTCAHYYRNFSFCCTAT